MLIIDYSVNSDNVLVQLGFCCNDASIYYYYYY